MGFDVYRHTTASAIPTAEAEADGLYMPAGDVSTTGERLQAGNQPSLRKKRNTLLGQDGRQGAGHVLELTGMSLDPIYIARF